MRMNTKGPPLVRYVGVTFCLLLPAAAQEKRNQLGFSIGAEFVPSNSLAEGVAGSGPREIKTSNSLALELNYGCQIHRFQRAELWLDVPALVGPNHKITNGNPLLPTSDATFYVTPSARLAFPIGRAWTPWVSAGGGYGLLETSDFFEGGANNPTIHTNVGVLQFGVGVDAKTPFHVLGFPIGVRGEFRDFFALSQPTFFVPVTNGSQNNLTVNGGLTIRF